MVGDCLRGMMDRLTSVTRAIWCVRAGCFCFYFIPQRMIRAAD